MSISGAMATWLMANGSVNPAFERIAAVANFERNVEARVPNLCESSLLGDDQAVCKFGRAESHALGAKLSNTRHLRIDPIANEAGDLQHGPNRNPDIPLEPSAVSAVTIAAEMGELV